jgi:hypothetical protein
MVEKMELFFYVSFLPTDFPRFKTGLFFAR